MVFLNYCKLLILVSYINQIILDFFILKYILENINEFINIINLLKRYTLIIKLVWTFMNENIERLIVNEILPMYKHFNAKLNSNWKMTFLHT